MLSASVCRKIYTGASGLQAPHMNSSVPLSYNHMGAFEDLDVSGLNALLDSMDTDGRAGWASAPPDTSSMTDINHVSRLGLNQHSQYR